MVALSLDDQEDEIDEAQRQVGSSVMENENLIGCFLTASIIHFPTMRSTLVNLWHSIKGVEILDLGKKGTFSKFFTRWI